MIVLIAFSFVAGIVTILSPCILPVLPIVLSGGISGGKSRPLGVVAGFILSFTFFTLAISTIVRLTGLPVDVLRTLSVVVVFLFGLTLLLPMFQVWMELLFNKLARFAPIRSSGSGFSGGFLLGISLGLIWTPCVGPIIASVITLAATRMVNLGAVLITLAYATGTAIPMLGITYGGRGLLNRMPGLLRNTDKIQRVFGVLMILVAIAINFNLDRKFQVYILDRFPQYGVGLTSIEDNTLVRKSLETLETADVGPLAPELILGGEWFNSTPLKLSELRGKVVLIDFWTYTCINCIRTLPYLKSWHEKYADEGLVIIGVHTPEFEFEKDSENVKRAIEDFEIKYPVMQDNDYKTWRAFNNRYWPAKYFIDKDGRIRSSHFGEGEYDESEKLIQELLGEIGVEIEDKIENPTYEIESRTPETYLGYSRMAGLTPSQVVASDKEFDYIAPTRVNHNEFALDGRWLVAKEFARPGVGAKLIFNYESKEVFLVMRPKGDIKGKVKVFLDGIEKQTIEVETDRLYQLIKLEKVGDHMLKLEFLDSNLEVFAFTFG